MSINRTLVTLLVALVLVGGLGACAEKPAAEEPDGAGSASADGDAAASGWAATLPTEPGYSWDTAAYPGGGTVQVELTATGPWTLTTGDDWLVTTSEIADPADVPGLEQFTDHDFVVRVVEGTSEYYYPRQVTDEWMLQLGKITVEGEQVTAEPYDEPLKFWPVDFEVGETFVVSDTGSFGINATVVARNAVTTPAGTIDEAYLVRFDYTALSEGAIEGTQYYILAPDVGLVALFSVAAGDEATGFTALDSAQVLVTMPEKR